MKRKTVVITALLCVLVSALWYSRVYQPTKASASAAREEGQLAAHDNQGLEAKVAQLKALEANGAQTDAELAQLHQALPEKSELASFIRVANTMASDAGIDWISVAPTEPSVGGEIATIPVSIQVKGGYFQVLDYLTKMEALPRLLIVDSVGISSSGAASSDAPGGAASVASAGAGSFGGAPELSVTIAARMFTTAGVDTTPAPAPGATVPGAVGATPTPPTPETAPAN